MLHTQQDFCEFLLHVLAVLWLHFKLSERRKKKTKTQPKVKSVEECISGRSLTGPLRKCDMVKEGMTLGEPGKKIGVQRRFKQGKEDNEDSWDIYA